MLVRRLPRSALMVGVTAAAVAALAACNNTNTGPGGVQTDTLTALGPNSGVMSSNNGVVNFFGASELETGDLDQSDPHTTERGLVTFLVALQQGDTVTSAVVRLDQCFTGGNPFPTLGSVLLETVPYSNPPGPTQFNGAAQTDTANNVLTSSADTGFVAANVTQPVAAAVLDSIPYVQFRVRFSNEDDNFNGTDDFVDFQGAFGAPAGHCVNTQTGQPVLILSFKT
jgi:hypothetical protein